MSTVFVHLSHIRNWPIAMLYLTYVFETNTIALVGSTEIYCAIFNCWKRVWCQYVETCHKKRFSQQMTPNSYSAINGTINRNQFLAFEGKCSSAAGLLLAKAGNLSNKGRNYKRKIRIQFCIYSWQHLSKQRYIKCLS